MKKTIINIAIILGIVAITFGATRQFFPKTKQVVQTDTTYIDKPYPVEKIVEKEVPVTVTKWKTDTVKVESVRVEKDTVFITTPSNIFNYHTSFLTQYPYAPKMLGVAVTQDAVSFTGLYPDGSTETKTWRYTPYWTIGYSDGDVAFREESGRVSDRFSHGIGVGQRFTTSGMSPYVKYEAGYDLFGVRFEGQIWGSEQPFLTAGVEYEF